jgi:nitroreductase
MKKSVDSSVPIHPILTERWSPRSFEKSAEISDADLTGILEAGRWAPSANNAQPWRFIVAKRGDGHFEKLARTFSGFNAMWAPTASAFILVATIKTNTEGATNPYAEYDAGLSAAYMTFEAVHRGLAVHQIAGFDRVQVRADYQLPDNCEPLAILIIGKQAPVDSLTDPTLVEREKAPRVRLPLSELIIEGFPKA